MIKWPVETYRLADLGLICLLSIYFNMYFLNGIYQFVQCFLILSEKNETILIISIDLLNKIYSVLLRFYSFPIAKTFKISIFPSNFQILSSFHLFPVETVLTRLVQNCTFIGEYVL
jgi:hypothetical protein